MKKVFFCKLCPSKLQEKLPCGTALLTNRNLFPSASSLFLGFIYERKI